MCRVAHFHSSNCGHHWLQIAQPCAPGRGFGTCATFGDGVAREPAAECRVGMPCPECASGSSSGGGGFGVGVGVGGFAGGAGMYDHNTVRMVTGMQRRWRWGVGPSRGDPGVECAVM